MPARIATVSVLFLLLACSGVHMGARKDGDGQASAALKNLALTDIKGNDIQFADFVGKNVVLMSFWATFCKPCKAEMPFLQKMHEKYEKDGLTVIAVSLDSPDTEAMVRPFIERNHYTFKVAVDEQSEVAEQLNRKSVLPFLVVLDRGGRIVLKKDGFAVGDQPELDAKLRGWLGK